MPLNSPTNVRHIGILHLVSDSTHQGFFKDQFRTARGSNSMASEEREPITGVWRRSPQRGSRGRAPGGGSGGRSPPEAECLSVFACPKEAANLPNY